MRVAVSARGKGLDSDIDMRFGRCPYFVIAEVKGENVREIQTVENIGIKQSGAAGIAAADLLARKGVKAVITEKIGERALIFFRQFAIEVYQGRGMVSEVLKMFARNQLREISKPGGPGRLLSMGRPAGETEMKTEPKKAAGKGKKQGRSRGRKTRKRRGRSTGRHSKL